MIVDCVTACCTNECNEEKNYGKSIKYFGGKVKAEHCANCSKTEESKELDVALKG